MNRHSRDEFKEFDVLKIVVLLPILILVLNNHFREDEYGFNLVWWNSLGEEYFWIPLAIQDNFDHVNSCFEAKAFQRVTIFLENTLNGFLVLKEDSIDALD